MFERSRDTFTYGYNFKVNVKFNPSLVLVQPRKIRPYITERLLMGRKELNQTNNVKFKAKYKK